MTFHLDRLQDLRLQHTRTVKRKAYCKQIRISRRHVETRVVLDKSRRKVKHVIYAGLTVDGTGRLISP